MRRNILLDKLSSQKTPLYFAAVFWALLVSGACIRSRNAGRTESNSNCDNKLGSSGALIGANAPMGPLQMKSIHLLEEASCIAFSNDGSTIAVAGSHNITILDKSGLLVAKIHSKGFRVEKLRLSSNGRVLLCVSGTGIFNSNRRIELWRAPFAEELITKELINRAPNSFENLNAWDADISPDGTTLICAGGKLSGLCSFSLRSNSSSKLSNGFDKYIVGSAAFSNDGKHFSLIAIDPDAAGGADELVFVLSPKDYVIERKYPLEGRELVGLIGSDPIVLNRIPNGGSSLINLRNQKVLMELPEHLNEIRVAAFFNDGNYLATIGAQLNIWNTSESKRFFTINLPAGQSKFALCTSAFGVAWLHGADELRVLLFK